MATNPGYSFTALLWEWEAQASWHFVSLPEDVADEIEERYGQRAGGFGSVRVRVTVGETCWDTSIFPDGKRGTYVLPIKKPVRRAEGLTAGDEARIGLEVLAPTTR